MSPRFADRAELVVLLVDAVLLAVLELFLLPLWIGGVPFPVTALLAAVTVPLLVRRAAKLGTGLLVAASPAVVWLLAILVFGLGGPGGDQVLLPDWRTLVLVGLGLLPAAVVLGSVTARPKGGADG